MPRRIFFNKILAITISLLLLSIIGVSALPFFAQFGTNHLLQVTGVLSNLACVAFLSYELRLYTKWKNWFGSFCRRNWVPQFPTVLMHCIVSIFEGRIEDRLLPVESAEVTAGSTGVQHKKTPHLLANVFFIGYCSSQIFRTITGIYLLQHAPQCATYLGLSYAISKILLACLLMAAIITLKPDTLEPTGSWVSNIGWGSTSVVSFSSAFKYVMQSAIFAYVQYSKHAIIVPDPPSDIMRPIIDQIEKCSEETIIPKYNDMITELNATFGTEYFSLAAFFSVFIWMNLNRSNTAESDQVSLCDVVVNIDETPEVGHECGSFCAFSISAKTAYLWIGFISAITLVYVAYFFVLMNSANYFGGVWITFFQNVVLQSSIFLLEVFYYRNHLRKMKASPKLKRKHELDLTLLIFPLFPYGINYALLDLPKIMRLFGPSETAFWIDAINIVYVTFQWVQMAFQAIFLAEVFSTQKKGTTLRQSKYFLLILATLNFCLWFSLTLECPLRTIHGIDSAIYGVPGSILIIYSTLPFVFFNIAHVTTVFLELFFELKISTEE